VGLLVLADRAERALDVADVGGVEHRALAARAAGATLVTRAALAVLTLALQALALSALALANAARHVLDLLSPSRRALVAAGWEVSQAPGLGRLGGGDVHDASREPATSR
jgi:hypothetical protein